MGKTQITICKELGPDDAKFNGEAWACEDTERDKSTGVVDWKDYLRYITVKDEGNTVGILSVVFKAGTGRITEVIVDNKARGKGYGELLMKECEKLARTMNVHKLWLETREEYVAGYNLYLKLGYVKEAKLSNDFAGKDFATNDKGLELATASR